MTTAHEAPALSEKDQEIIAVGASIASGCLPCTTFHLRAASRTGASEREILQAVRDATSVRSAATEIMARAGGPSSALAGNPVQDSTEARSLIRELVRSAPPTRSRARRAWTHILQRLARSGRRIGRYSRQSGSLVPYGTSPVPRPRLWWARPWAWTKIAPPRGAHRGQPRRLPATLRAAPPTHARGRASTRASATAEAVDSQRARIEYWRPWRRARWSRCSATTESIAGQRGSDPGVASWSTGPGLSPG